jgi:sodium-coupled neutral amino acid transporter 9
MENLSAPDILNSQPKQSSLVTIFSIWNTMMGTSLLSLPWGIEQAGPIPATFILILMASLTFYTAYLVLKSPKLLPPGTFINEFTDVCERKLGKWAKYLGLIFTLIAFFGAMLIYWVLMSNFLTFTGYLAQDIVKGNISEYVLFQPEVVCHEKINASLTGINSLKHVWNPTTVPIFLAVLIFPLLFVDDVVFFTKFNALGTISVLNLVVMAMIKMVLWRGINITREELFYYNPVGAFKFSGMLSLALLIHNAIITIMRNNFNQDNNTRDLAIGYGLTSGTYLVVGMMFFLGIPFSKKCIADNILNNFLKNDLMIAIARIFLLFQMGTVFPLLAYLFRSNLMSVFYPETMEETEILENDDDALEVLPELEETYSLVDPTIESDDDEAPLIRNSNSAKIDKKKFVQYMINITILFCCIITAVFFPNIGKLIGLRGVCVELYSYSFYRLPYIGEQVRWRNGLVTLVA